MMHWASWSAFWAMGGYALFVWGSYAVTLVVIVTEIILLRHGRNDTLKRLKRMRKWEEQ
jgi:heme exporter protein D